MLLNGLKIKKALWIMFPMGFASGLPLALSSGTLQAWLTTEGVDIKTIGTFSLVALPYSLKFLWAPLMDGVSFPFLGRRRGWIFAAQLLLTLCCVGLAFLDPKGQINLIALFAIFLAFFSASQDIVIDAYRTDILEEKERGLGVGLTVTGYRIAMLVSGALALILSEFIGWHKTYLLMALIMALSSIFTLIADEPKSQFSKPANLKEAVIEPIKDLFKRLYIKELLFLIVLYKLGDAFAGTLTTAFLIRGVGFSPAQVGAVNKGLGLFATIVGTMAGGAIMTRMKLFKALFLFGVLQAISNLSFMLLALIGKSLFFMIFAVGLENICGGMGTAAFVSFLMSMCNQKFSATQYAILSALASFGRVFIGPLAGEIVAKLGWANFFFITFLAALPGVALILILKRPLMLLGKKAMDKALGA